MKTPNFIILGGCWSVCCYLFVHRKANFISSCNFISRYVKFHTMPCRAPKLSSVSKHCNVYRLWVVPHSLRISRGHFVLAVFFHITHDVLSERGTFWSILRIASLGRLWWGQVISWVYEVTLSPMWDITSVK